MRPLDEIQPIPGTQDYLLEKWIDPSEFEKVKRHDGQPDVYHDGTYDWYGGFGAFAPDGPILEIGVYKGFSMAAMLRGKERKIVCLVDSEQEQPTSLSDAAARLFMIHTETVFWPSRLNTQTDEWMKVSRLSYALIHIDADHSYEGCLNDLRHFAPMTGEGGIVVVHDTKDEPVFYACTKFLMDNEDWEYRRIDTVNGNLVLRRRPE